MTDFSNLPYRPCAGIMLANTDGQIFTGQRIDAGKSKYPDTWQMPQGGIDDGEDAETAYQCCAGQEYPAIRASEKFSEGLQHVGVASRRVSENRSCNKIRLH